MRFKQYLNEKTFSISADVDMIYKKYFKKYVKPFHKKGGKANRNDLTDFKEGMDKVHKDGKWYFGNATSEILKSKTAKKAHELNPVTLVFGAWQEGSFYNYSKKAISFSLNSDVLHLLSTSQSKLDIRNMLQGRILERFMNELSEENIKGTIYHELSHWINDSIYNQNIQKRVQKNLKTKEFDITTVNFTDFELDAQVHAIKQLKRSFTGDWNYIRWYDIIQKKPSFSVVFAQLKQQPKAVQMDYFKRISKRLNRENLMGKNLKDSFKKELL